VAIVSRTRTVDDAGLAALREPRDDLLLESPTGEDRWTVAEGPFTAYERTLAVEREGPGRHRVTERIDYRLAVPIWRPVMAVPVRRLLLREPGRRRSFWTPPTRMDRRAATVLSLLAAIAVVHGSAGTMLTQTIAFAADEFRPGQDNAFVQSLVLSSVRVEALLALALTMLADRRGRRILLLVSGTITIAATAAGALAPSLLALGATQVVARGANTALRLVVVVLAAEELPKGSRAYGLSLLSMAAGLGAGITVWFLPLADISEQGWRLVYLVPVLATPLLVVAYRRLPESRRYAPPAERRGGRTPASVRRGRLVLLGTTFFLTAVFATPASQLQNAYLKDDRGFTGAGITLLTLVTATPAAISVLVGGRLADTYGRRIIAVVGLVGSTGFVILHFGTAGLFLWLGAFLGLLFGGLTVPSLGTYSPELFSTRGRGTGTALVHVAGVVGSVTGLLVVGILADRTSFVVAFGVAAVAPLLAALLVLTRYPETARMELEEINPEDVGPPGTLGPCASPGGT
jgi:MFS family permease